jgi:hypothetical protein
MVFRASEMFEKVPAWAMQPRDETKEHAKPKELSFDKRLWTRSFGFPNQSMKLSDVGVYSIAKRHTSRDLIEFIKENTGGSSNLIITESHGGVGGFTRELARVFTKVNVVEIEPLHCEIIHNNMTILGVRKNVEIHNASFLDCLELREDVIVCDPPWGGPSYIKKSALKLYIDGIHIAFVIAQLMKQKPLKGFVLFAPKNFDFNSFHRNIGRTCIARKTGEQFLIFVK